MTGWQPIEGGTLFMASGPQGDHLFVVVLGPRQIANYGPQAQFVLVPFCTAIPGGRHETTCLISPGEHPFVKQPTYVDYGFAQVRNESELRAGVTRLIFRPADSVTLDMLQRIQTGLAISKRVARHIRRDFLSSGP
uniref:Uncharacterized protein n=1 Tax=mine drainage metagenome TaxID=410659 RepID=E6QPG1_9ZZZZ